MIEYNDDNIRKVAEFLISKMSVEEIVEYAKTSMRTDFHVYRSYFDARVDYYNRNSEDQITQERLDELD